MAPRSGEDSNPRPLANRSKWLLFGAIGLAVVAAAVLGLVFGLPQKDAASKTGGGSGSGGQVATTSTGASTNSPWSPVKDDGASKAAVQVPASTSSSPGGQKSTLPTTAVRLPDLSKAIGGSSGGECPAATYDEIVSAIANTACGVITLTGRSYKLSREIVVTRTVLITGSSAVLPYIDASDAIRAFRVTDGAYLELRYVRILQGRGIIRPRNIVRRDLQEGQGTLATRDLYGPGMMVEIRGGSVYFEAASLGGTFVGVVFMDDETSASAVEDAVLQTLTMTGVRIYGGHVYIAAGAVRFLLCVFWDFEVFTTLSDRIYVGGDVLVLAGEADFSGCVWQYTTVIGQENGAGFNVAVLGGVATFTGCYFQENNAVVGFNGAGQAFFVGGGVQVLTGLSFVLFSAVELFTGTGDFSVFGGVQIVTGVSINDYYGLLAAFGAGFDFFVGGGYTIHTGVSLNQWNGPLHNALAGGYSFVGGGEFVGIGSPYISYNSIGSEFGVGGVHWLGGGLNIFIGSPIIDIAGVFAAGILGEYTGTAGGFYIAIGCPYIEYSGVETFLGLGGTVFVGGGAAVMGYSPLVESVGLINEHFDFWIGGTCEPEEGAWAGPPPFLVVPGGPCEEAEEEEEPPEEGGRRVVKRRRRRAQVGGNTSSSGDKIGLLAVGVEKISINFNDEEGRQTLAPYVPANLMEAVGQLSDLLHPASLQPVTSKGPATFFVNNVDGYCGVCGSSSLSGPGAKSCEAKTSCSDLHPPAGSPVPLSPETVDYPETYVVLSNLDIHKAHAGVQVDLPTLASAVRSALGEEVKDPTDVQDQMKLQVKVWSAEIDPFFSTDPLAGELKDRESYKVALVVHDEDKSHALIEALQQEEQSVDEAPLARGIRAYLLEKGVELVEASVGYDRILFAPSYKSELMAKNKGSTVTDVGKYSVVLVDEDTPSHPVTHVTYNKVYHLYISNFGGSRLVKISAVSATDEAASFQLTTALTDLKGSAEIKYQFSATDPPPGDYYIKVVDAMGQASGASPVLSFSKQARRRRLYGPLMYM